VILQKTYQSPSKEHHAMWGAEPDVLRSMLQRFIDALMGAEADALCGAPYGARSDDRVNFRNGYRARE
jgi:putative transposase